MNLGGPYKSSPGQAGSVLVRKGPVYADNELTLPKFGYDKIHVLLLLPSFSSCDFILCIFHQSRRQHQLRIGE